MGDKFNVSVYSTGNNTHRMKDLVILFECIGRRGRGVQQGIKCVWSDRRMDLVMIPQTNNVDS